MFMVDLGAPSYYSVLGIMPDADVREIRAIASKTCGDLERAKHRTSSPEEKRRLEERMVNINKISDELSDGIKRSQYDRRNVHLTFFLVRKAAAPIWQERKLLLRWLHLAVRDFLQTKGEALAPLTDLDRSDFTADFTENDLLERLLADREDTGGRLE
jgi:curved DNA-binding protein CbpA